VYPHHTASIYNVTAFFEREPEVQALLLGGSLAHGCETETSDIDILIVVSDLDHARRSEAGHLHFSSRELCTYDGGYVDGKYLSTSFLTQVAAAGSEPARFAFQGAQVLLSRLPAVEATLRAITRYPIEGKAERLRRFYAQFEAWHWYTHEALRLGNRYLLGVAISKMVLFGGRMILAENECLYPFHKWFLRVLAGTTDRPPDLMARIDNLYAAPTGEAVEAFYNTIRGFRAWDDGGVRWPVQFMADSELNWLDGATPVDDL